MECTEIVDTVIHSVVRWKLTLLVYVPAGDQIDDNQPRRQKIRVSNPPGGKSSNLW